MAVYKITFYVPHSHLEEVKAAMFASKAGTIGQYDCCAWQVKGQGQFRALAGSQPFIGQINQIEKVEEYRVEMVCKAEYLAAAIKALKEQHPYEEPAYDVIELLDI